MAIRIFFTKNEHAKFDIQDSVLFDDDMESIVYDDEELVDTDESDDDLDQFPPLLVEWLSIRECVNRRDAG